MTETADEIRARAEATLARVQNRLPEVTPRPRRRGASVTRRLTLMLIANALILLAAAVVGMILPLGMFGALAVMLVMAAVTIGIAFAPTGAPPALEKLRELPLKALPAQTGRWLDAQRPALRAPAISLTDRIGARLDTLGVQLASLNEDEPAAAEVRKLVGEQLPDFVRGYTRVPDALRTVPRNGKTPDAQLVDGLKVIDDQLAEMSNQLAQGDLDSLQTRGRFLEIKYRGDDAA